MTLITAGALAFGINIIVSAVKRWIYPKFGAFGVQVTAFVLAGLGALYVLYGGHFPGLQEFLLAAGAVFSTTVTFYEVVLQHFDIFKGTSPELVAARQG